MASPIGSRSALTPDQKAVARDLYAKGYRARDLAVRYGVCTRTMQRVVQGITRGEQRESRP